MVFSIVFLYPESLDSPSKNILIEVINSLSELKASGIKDSDCLSLRICFLRGLKWGSFSSLLCCWLKRLIYSLRPFTFSPFSVNVFPPRSKLYSSIPDWERTKLKLSGRNSLSINPSARDSFSVNSIKFSFGKDIAILRKVSALSKNRGRFSSIQRYAIELDFESAEYIFLRFS